MATELAQCYIPNHPPLNQDPKPRPALGLYAKELTTAPCNPSQAHVHEMSQESKRTWGSRMGAPGKRSLTTLKSQWPCQENTITLTGPQARGPASYHTAHAPSVTSVPRAWHPVLSPQPGLCGQSSSQGPPQLPHGCWPPASPHSLRTMPSRKLTAASTAAHKWGLSSIGLCPAHLRGRSLSRLPLPLFSTTPGAHHIEPLTGF